MIKQRLSSRERMLAALNQQEPDVTPCSFIMYKGLKSKCRDYVEFVERQVALGLDAYVDVPSEPPVVVNDHYNLHGLPVRYDPRVEVREWIEHPPDRRSPVMIKEYHTPGGILRAEVCQTDDWRWGDHVPFLDDYIIPRSRRFVVTGPEDLPALRYLLAPLSATDRTEFQTHAEQDVALARRHDLLTVGGWGVGADLVGWVYGLEAMIFAAHDRPDFVRELLDVVARWNRERMELVLEAGVDLYVKRAWYENCDFWTPATYREFLLPILRADVELAHARGSLMGYIITSNCMPLLDLIAESGVDVVIGVDPDSWDLSATKRRLAGKICLWGGVNGHLTVEQGLADEVRTAVQHALDTLGPNSFILSPVDNVRQDTPQANANVKALIEQWRGIK